MALPTLLALLPHTGSSFALLPPQWRMKNQPSRCSMTSSPSIADDTDTKEEDDAEDDLARYLQRAEQQRLQEQNSWFSDMDKVPFDCTSCGKCCKTKGSVWMAPEEVDSAAELLDLNRESFIQTYGTHTLQDDRIPDKTWLRLTNNDKQACVFLDEQTNLCRIYEARPIQCSTYPFWPNIMDSPASWNAEVRLPDEHTTDGSDGSKGLSMKYWTPEGGGCEGMKLNASPKDDYVEIGVPSEDAKVRLQASKRDKTRLPGGKAKPIER